MEYRNMSAIKFFCRSDYNSMSHHSDFHEFQKLLENRMTNIYPTFLQFFFVEIRLRQDRIFF